MDVYCHNQAWRFNDVISQLLPEWVSLIYLYNSIRNLTKLLVKPVLLQTNPPFGVHLQSSGRNWSRVIPELSEKTNVSVSCEVAFRLCQITRWLFIQIIMAQSELRSSILFYFTSTKHYTVFVVSCWLSCHYFLYIQRTPPYRKLLWGPHYLKQPRKHRLRHVFHSWFTCKRLKIIISQSDKLL